MTATIIHKFINRVPIFIIIDSNGTDIPYQTNGYLENSGFLFKIKA